MKRAKGNSYLRPIGFDAKGDPITQVMIEVAPDQFVNEVALQRLALLPMAVRA